jgi:hypothetical protein
MSTRERTMSKREKVVRAWGILSTRGELELRMWFRTRKEAASFRGAGMGRIVRVEIRVVPKARKKAKAAQRAAGGGA